MPKPSTVPTWATTTLYATSADPAAVGQPTKNDPSSIAAQGWDYATRPDPTFFNFWMSAVGTDWLGWIDTDVLSTEGGNYTMNAPLNLSNQGIGIGGSAELTIATDGFCYLNGQGFVTATGELTFQAASTTTFAVAADETHENIPIFHNGMILSVAGTLSASSAVDLDINGPADFSGIVTTTGLAAQTRVQGTASGNQSIAATTRYFVVPSGYGGGNGILADGTFVGQAKTITSFEGSGGLLLKRANGSTAITDTAGGAITVLGGNTLGTTDYNWVTVLWNGTFWEFSQGFGRA